MKVVNWNIEWATTRSARGRAIHRKLVQLEPDLICLTEASASLLPDGGEVLESEPDYGYGAKGSRRKVLLWARDGFSEATTDTPKEMPPGRFISAVTHSRSLRLVGVCIPWSRAHVSSGSRNRKPWQDHVGYLVALRSYLESVKGENTCVLGDFRRGPVVDRGAGEARAARGRCPGR